MSLISKFLVFIRSRWLISLILPAMLVLAACAPAASTATQAVYPTLPPAPTATSMQSTSQAGIPVTGSQAGIDIASDPNLGQHLVGANGMTLYLFEKDQPNQSNCNAACLKLWPPLKAQGTPTLGSGVDASLVGTGTLTDGTQVVTYNKHPLYFFIKDKKPGDVTGENVGNVWFVVSPSGNAVKPAAQATPTQSANQGYGYSQGYGNSAATSAPTVAASEAVINVTTNPSLGQILTGANGKTLYAFLNDKADVSNCNATCLQKWPALVTQGNPVLGSGVNASMIGTTTDANGQKIITYNHMPLYYFGKDTKAGDTNGQGVGSVWFVVSPAGTTVQK